MAWKHLQWLVSGLVAGVVLAFPALAGAEPAPTPITIGTSADDLAGIAVDSSGTAYIAWEDSSTSTPFLHYCKLPAGATTCSVSYSSAGQAGGLNPPQNSNCAGLLGTPSVVLEGSDVLVFAYDNCSGIDNGEAGWVSTDGGHTFTNEPPGETMSFTPPNNDSTTTNPVAELGNGLVGVGYVVPGGSPQFQAVQYDPATSTFQTNYNGNTGPFATLDPSNQYSAGNLGGEFAAVPIGSANAGVMGAVSAFPNAAQDPCPGGPPFTAWAFAPLSASTTQGALNTNPGAAGSAWTHALTPLDCNTEDPAVAGGPAGFGILDGSFTSAAATTYHRFNAATGTFGAPVTLAAEDEVSPSLSQDGAGGVYATWGAHLTDLRLAYSPDGGTTWDGPVTLQDSSASGSALGDPASAVNGGGAGWATYHVGGTQYALPFTKISAIVAPTESSSGVSNGKTVTLSITCQSTPCTVTITITGTETIITHTARAARAKRRHKTITIAGGTFTLKKAGANKVAVRLSRAGKALLAKDHGRLKGSILVGLKVGGVTVKGATHTFKITTSKNHKH